MKTRIRSVKINAILNIIKQCSNIIFPLITYPYVSRVLGAEGVGKYSFPSSLTSILATVAALGIPTYAVREGARIRENKKEIYKLSSELFTINLIAMIFVLFFLGIATTLVPRLKRESLLIYILSLNIVTSVLGRDWINSVYEDFLFITIRYILFQSIAVVLIFTFVKEPSDFIVYTCITVFGNSGGYLANILHTQKLIPIGVTLHPNLKKHIRPILFLLGTALAIQLYVQSDITILGFFRSTQEVGIYTIASKIYEIIKSLLNAVIIVTVPRLSKYIGNHDFESYNFLLEKLRSSLCVLVFPCIVGLFMEASNIMILIGGTEYLSGVPALRVLCAALALAVFGCFFSSGVLVPVKRDKFYFIATIVSAVENIVLNIVFIPLLGIVGAALTTVIAEFIVMTICRYYSKQYIQKGKIKDYILITVGCIVICCICKLAKLFEFNTFGETAFSCIVSMFVYFFVLYIGKNTIVCENIERLVLKL